MNVLSKTMYNNKFPEFVEYNNAIRTSFKMKPADVEPETYINFSEEFTTKNP